MLKDLGSMMKMQRDLKAVQKSLKKSTATAENHDGTVKATVNGEFSLMDLSIDESLLEPSNKDKLQRQIISTINKAVENSKENASREMKKITGGLNIPGLDKFLG